MNIVVEEQPNCQVALRVEVPADRVNSEWESISKEFRKIAKIPGYRPGKIPSALVERRFSKEIREQVEKNIIRESIQKATAEKGLEIIAVSEVSEIELTPERAMNYTATLITAPDFELPDYKGVEIEIAEQKISDSEIEEALDRLRDPHAEYDPVEGRGLEMGDFAVLSFSSSLDGQPLKESHPKAPPMLLGRENFWMEMEENSFVKGFAAALAGLKPDEEKSFEITLDADFPYAELQGKTLKFDVNLHTINLKKLPEWTDELAAKVVPETTFEQLKEMVQKNLEKGAENNYEQSKRSMVLKKIMEQITCDLPTKMVASETASVLRDIVQENQARGIDEAEIRGHQDEILGAAQQSAEERVRSRFVLLKIAKEEKIEAEDKDVIEHISHMAAHYRIPIKKLISDLKKRDGIEDIREQIQASKALEFIASNAKISEPVAG
ncbi:MAG: trigger factor [Chthoniobacterales bacterium]